MNHVERIILIVKLDLVYQCWGQASDYSDAYKLVKGAITVTNTAAADKGANNTNKKVIFKNCVQFTSCISIINNAELDNAQYIDVVMQMYHRI